MQLHAGVVSHQLSDIWWGLIYTRRHELYWLDISERIQFHNPFSFQTAVHRCHGEGDSCPPTVPGLPEIRANPMRSVNM